MKKSVMGMVLGVMMASVLASGCSSSTGTASSTAVKNSTAAAAKAGTTAAAAKTGTTAAAKSGTTAANKAASGKSYTVGIAEFAEVASLDNCREGFLKGLKDEGIEEGKNLTVLYENANADGSTATQIANDFLTKKADLICAIATPTAQAAYAASKGKTPVIFTAVTDPVAAELAKSDGTPVGEITGTSDKLPVDAQLKMIRKVLPNAKKVGILYTTSEINSVSAVKEYKSLSSGYGFEIVESGVAAPTDIAQAADNLLTKVDCITMLTDNTVVASLPVVLKKANDKKIPVFGSEVEQVKNGCLASEGLEYVSLGEQTGKMAAKVLKGEKKASELNFETVKDASFYGNNKVASNLGITFPDDLKKSAAKMFDSITEK